MVAKKTIKVSKLGEVPHFQVTDKNGDILFECTDIFRNWGINRCAEWIRRYNEEHENDGKITEPEPNPTDDAKSDTEIKKSNFEFSSVVGIKNGGVPISKFISESLEKIHYEITISFYDGKFKRKNPVVDFSGFHDDKPFLLVDDITDNGSTLKYFENHSNFQRGSDYMIAVLHWNPLSSVIPDFYSEQTNGEWVIYPWEKKHAKTN